MKPECAEEKPDFFSCHYETSFLPSLFVPPKYISLVLVFVVVVVVVVSL